MATRSNVLQAATVISKTNQTLIGSVIETGDYDYITLFFTYVKGDETGLTIVPSMMRTSTGTAHPFAEWSSAAGAKTVTSSTFTLTASRNGYMTFDVRGIPYIMFTQGGTSNDGTPTGTLAASYTLK
jgi:hypothetical protein